MNKSSIFSTLFAGFRFGMTLQFAVGPVSLFLFQAAALAGFLKVYPSTFAVVFVDGVCIMLAILGIGSLMQKSSRFRSITKYFGAAVLIIFAIFMIASVFNKSDDEVVNFTNFSALKLFILTVIMTSSSPITLIFWAGVFSLKVAENPSIKYNVIFGVGSLISTVIFFTCWIAFASFAGSYLSYSVIQTMNIIVGCYLIYVAIKTLGIKLDKN